MNPSGVRAHTSSFSEKTRQKTRFTIPYIDMFGEVFICQFPFTSGARSKTRPALVLFDLRDDVIICRVTSAQRSGPWILPCRIGKQPDFSSRLWRALIASSPQRNRSLCDAWAG